MSLPGEQLDYLDAMEASLEEHQRSSEAETEPHGKEDDDYTPPEDKQASAKEKTIVCPKSTPK